MHPLSASVFPHHLEALRNNDLVELMKDYTEDSEVWTPDGEMIGLNAISALFANAFTLFPKGHTTIEVKKTIAKGNKVYVVWTADSPTITVSFAADNFEINEGKILWHSMALQVAQK